MRKVFRIAREESVHSPLFVVHISDGVHIGRGECGELRHYGESNETLVAALEKMSRRINECSTPALLNSAFPPGSARNAVDCALWDLSCKRSGRSIWQLTGVAPRPHLEIDCSIGIAAVEDMCRTAEGLAGEGYREIKIKVDADRVIETVSAISRAAPDVRLIVDANEAWSIRQLQEVAAPLRELKVVMIEQPLHRRDDHQLEAFDSPVPLYADESCATSGDLERLALRYDGINIKLDKCGGLTEALKMVREARERRLGVMIGCNSGTSLGLAPAYVVGALCDFRDLDSAALLLEDRAAGMRYERGKIWCFTPRLWG